MVTRLPVGIDLPVAEQANQSSPLISTEPFGLSGLSTRAEDALSGLVRRRRLWRREERTTSVTGKSTTVAIIR